MSSNNISRKDISEIALKVLYRLNKAGYRGFMARRRRGARFTRWAKNQKISDVIDQRHA
ncbi:hypothetical protein MJ560_05205 [Klebsiella pneumoniae]|nr:hypothetical protein MJ560_05205 [Klebsiella pneumoniae]